MWKKLLIFLSMLPVIVLGSQQSFAQVAFDNMITSINRNSESFGEKEEGADGRILIKGKSYDKKNNEVQTLVSIGSNEISIEFSKGADWKDIISCFPDTVVTGFLASFYESMGKAYCAEEVKLDVTVVRDYSLWEFFKVGDKIVGRPQEQKQLKDTMDRAKSFASAKRLDQNSDDEEKKEQRGEDDDGWNDTVDEELAIAEQDSAAAASSSSIFSLKSLLGGFLVGKK